MNCRKYVSWLVCCLLGLSLFCGRSVVARERNTALSALHVEKTKLKNQNGQNVQLQGFSTHGLAWFPEYAGPSALADMKAMGASAVRLALYPHEYNGYCTGGDQTWLKSLIRQGVDAAQRLGMYVIIDWHVLQEQNPLVYKDQARAFFAEMSSIFKNKTHVIYEICNEPNGDTTWQNIKDYARKIIPAIRQNDPDAVILVGTPRWSQELDKAAADPLPYDNIMYTLHFYAGTHTEDLRNVLRQAYKTELPVFVSEFGITDVSGQGNISEAQADTWLQLLDAWQISYMNWSWSNKNEGCSAIRPEVVKTGGISWNDLSRSGQWFVSHLKKQTSALSVDSGWQQQQDGWRYLFPDGSLPRNCWQQIAGSWYHFDPDGWMQTGWIQVDHAWYYLKSSGVMACDTFVGSYYLNSQGKWIPGRTSGWVKEGSRWWYRNSDGSYPKNTWKQIAGRWYHFDPGGWMQTGWITIHTQRYHLSENGILDSHSHPL